jgi:Thioredoxin
MARYPEKVKWVFRDYPIATLHPTAAKAHEAARCAGEQGKFWEYHDLLFERSPATLWSSLNNTPASLTLTDQRLPNAWKVANTRRKSLRTSRKERDLECLQLPLSLSTGACYRVPSLSRFSRSSSKASSSRTSSNSLTAAAIRLSRMSIPHSAC